MSHVPANGSPRKAGPYGSFRPATAPVSRKAPEPAAIDDVRHAEENPMPWLRYFFPKDFNLREGKPTGENPYYQFFDVAHLPMQEDTAMPPPDWAPNAYFQLSFTQLHVPPGMVLAERIPHFLGPQPTGPDGGAVDLTRENAFLLQPGNEALMREIVDFCRSLVTFRARTWKDAMPLVDLLRGVLMYLLNHYEWGAALVKEQARRDADAALEAEKEALRAQYARQLEAERERMRAEYEEKLEAMREELRMTLAEDLTMQLRAEREEKNQLRHQISQLEAQLRKASDTQATLQRQIAHAAQELEAEIERGRAALAARDEIIKQLRDQMAALKKRLEGAQRAVVNALNAKTKEDAIGVAMDAIASSMPAGTASYIAELRTAADVDKEDPTTTFLAEVESAMAASGLGADAADGGGATGELPPAFAMMQGVTPGLMGSPLAGVAGGGLGPEGRLSTAGGTGGSRPSSSTIAGASFNEVKQQLVFKYVRATPNHAFMLGQKLAYGSGVSWPLVDGSGPVHVADVAGSPGVWYFRGREALGGDPHGAYYAAPITGNSGEVIGMFCVDTLAAAAAAGSGGGGDGGRDGGAGAGAGALDAADVLFVRGLAEAVGARARADQEAFSEAMLALAMAAAEDAPEPAPPPVDPELFAPADGLTGGLKLFKEALQVLGGLSDEDLEALRNLDEPDEATLAVIKSVLAAVGELTGNEDWAAVRQHITRDLLDRLLRLDPQAAWAEWQALCKAFRPLNELPVASLHEAEQAAEEPSAPPSLRASGAFARWADAVRVVAAARALQELLEVKLQKANAALMKTFSGDSCNALTELRSYRVPPPICFATVQCVLMLSGCEEEDCRNWARMRTLCNYRLIKRLVTLRPAQIARRVFKAVGRLIKDLNEADVKQESTATLSLYRWLSDFTRLASVG